MSVKVPEAVRDYINATISFEIAGTKDGWVKLPGDTGGQTMWGLSVNNNPDLAKKILSRTLTRDEAIEAYYVKYYLTIPMVGLMDARMAFYLFDSKVHGAYVPVVELQEWLNDVHGPKLIEDGSLGNKTAEAVYKMTAEEVVAFLAHCKSEERHVARRMADNTMAAQKRKRLTIVDYYNGFLNRFHYRIATSEKFQGDDDVRTS